MQSNSHPCRWYLCGSRSLNLLLQTHTGFALLLNFLINFGSLFLNFFCCWFVANNITFWPKNVLGRETENLQRCQFIPTWDPTEGLQDEPQAELSSLSPSPQNSTEMSWGCPPNQQLHINVSLWDFFFPLLIAQNVSQAFQGIIDAHYPSYTGFLQSRAEHLIKFVFAVLGHKKTIYSQASPSIRWDY